MKDISSRIPSFAKNKKIVVVGFGSQGSHQSQNLKDSGFQVKIALKEGSPSIEVAKNLGFEVVSFKDGVQEADILILLTPDESHAEFFKSYINPQFKKGGTIIVAHGFSFHFGYVKNFEDYNIGMIAPKAVGRAVRGNFLSGAGIFSLIASFHQVNDDLNQILLDIAFGIGSKKVLETTFQEECESDLFGEQTVLCGGVISLFKSAFDVMCEAGFPPIIAYYECVHELKLIADLIYEKGVNSMFSSISNTAKYGGFTTGDFLINEGVKERMRQVLTKIKDGSFASSFMHEALEKNYQFKQEINAKFANSSLERAGQEVIHLLKNLK